MEFYYASCWLSDDGRAFKLSGIIAARPGEAAAHFPEDPDEQHEWEVYLGAWMSSDLRDYPMPLLHEITDRGNGISEEYGPVQEIHAQSIEIALREAYDRVVAERGRTSVFYENVIPGRSSSLSDPFEGLLPDPLLPGRK